jgi:hypothetical protein
VITVGLIKELYYLSFISTQTLHFEMSSVEFNGWVLKPNQTLKIVIKPDGILDIFYKENHIWHESVDGELSFFGVESCDTISRIMSCIDNNDSSWKEKYYYNEQQAKNSLTIS